LNENNVIKGYLQLDAKSNTLSKEKRQALFKSIIEKLLKNKKHFNVKGK
jgi:hypothetical protein